MIVLTALWTVMAFAAEAMPAPVREVLVSEFQFSADDLEKIESGKATAKIVPTGKPDDVRLAGVVKLNVSSEAFIRAFRDIEHFPFSKEALQTGRFHNPPNEADLKGYQLTDLSKSDVMACRPGACAYKLPEKAMVDLQTKIDWDAPDAGAKAEALAHQLWIAGLTDYQQRGDAALAVYHDSSQPFSVADGLRSLIRGEARLWSNFPDLLGYAEHYPKGKPASAEDLFYWQEAAFGLKHVVRIQHVIIQKVQPPKDTPPSDAAHYAILSKMLFASHYFRAAMEFSYIYPVNSSTIYFVTAQRSYVDGMTGFKGAILRKVAEGRSPGTLVKNLELAKKYLENR